MGRKNKSKKKTVEEGDGSPPPPPPPPPPNPEQLPKPKKKKDRGSNRTYLKIKAVFKCSGEHCSKKWSSVHAWERDEKFFCEFCGGKADVVDFKDEMCELANYYCGTQSCGGHHWQSIHGGGTGRMENCDICGAGVQPNGTQNRFGRHFWFVCISQSCGEGWEDFSLTPQRTQRCSKCKSRGDIIGTTKIKENEDVGKGGGGHRGAMAHNWENCDMCQDLKAQGKASTCLRYRKVHCKVEQVGEGVYTEIITGIQ